MRGDASPDALGGFELLLNSPADIELVANGPWWTRRHTIAALAVSSLGLAALLAWVVALRRTVAHRSVLLEKEVRERQAVEQRRLLEQERARIAQDLHDELGAGLTQISLMGSMAARAGMSSEYARDKAAGVAAKARELVAALDEIVWALNPRHDTAGAVRGYLCDHAEEFLRAAGIGCRLETSASVPELTLNASQRHELFLAFKEVLTNIVKHSGATEVRVGFEATEAELVVRVEDNGKGMPAGPAGATADGLANMRDRLARIGGRCDIGPGATGGARVSLRLPARMGVSR
jgi:signal transduction histidine kinase